MRLTIINSILAVFLTGCFDLNFDDTTHVVDELEILAIHTEPAELDPNTPLFASVLVGSPGKGTEPIQTAWRVRYLASINASESISDHVFIRNQSRDTLTLPPAGNLKAFERGDHPVIQLDVFLCQGAFSQLEAIQTHTIEDLFPILCKDAALATGSKTVLSPTALSAWDHLFGLNEPIDVFVEQQNPQITQLWLDNIPVRSLEKGGETVFICQAPFQCDKELIEMSATLNPASIDNYTLLKRGSDDLVGIEYHELHRVDWYVTDGELIQTSTYYSELADSYNQEMYDNQPTVKTYWRIPTKPIHHTITLYVVARDERGGNDWRTYRLSLNTP